MDELAGAEPGYSRAGADEKPRRRAERGSVSGSIRWGQRCYRPEAVLYLYALQGDGRHTAPSNAAFDASAGRTIPIGACDLGSRSAAAQHGQALSRESRYRLTNLSVVFRRSAP
jgi:hypothetical protein